MKPTSLATLLKGIAAIIVFKVLLVVILNYVNYWPPNFQNDFLSGRERYFSGVYQLAFYTHIVSGPLTFLMAMLLVSDSLCVKFSTWHRIVGRWNVFLILFFLVPSGTLMAFYPRAGPVAGAGLLMLAALSGFCTVMGWRAAVRRKFLIHRRWMLRTFVLLSSAVVLRLMGGAATMLGVSVVWFDPLATWLSWCLPLLCLEIVESFRERILGD
jgi:uncharacterized membrane protein YozB (DUF420 family)